MAIDINDAIISNILSIMNGGRHYKQTSLIGLQIKSDYVNSALSYFGIAERDAAESDEAWNIYRVVKSNNDITILTGNGIPFKMIWDDREDYFDGVSISNLFSTNFDGINDYAAGSEITALNTALAWSVSLYVKPQNLSAQRCIVSQAENGGSVKGWFLYHLSGTGFRLQMRPSGSNTITDFTDVTLTAGQWSHVVLTYSGNSNLNGAKLYVDGVASAQTPTSQALSGTLLGSFPFTVGARNQSFPFSGKIDDVRVYNKELSASEVSDLYATTPVGDHSSLSFIGNQINNWEMGDDDTEPTVTDRTGSNNLILTNGPTFVMDVP